MNLGSHPNVQQGEDDQNCSTYDFEITGGRRIRALLYRNV